MAITHDIRLTGKPEIDQFLNTNGLRLLPTTGNTYYWNFVTATDPKNITIEPVSNEVSKAMVRTALESISNVVNIHFKEVNYDVTYNNGFGVAAGTIYYSNGGGADLNSRGAGITIRTLNYPEPYPHYSTAAHEVLHLLGFSDGAARNPAYTTVDSVMSYRNMFNDTYGEKFKVYEYDASGKFLDIKLATNVTLGIYDIQALQSIYGANREYNAGNTTYKYTPETLQNFATLWDGGGNDTIDVSAFTLGVELNLNGGTRSNLFIKATSLNGWEYDGTRAIGIAYGANIENALGGKGNDVIYGNELRNDIRGGAGNDKLYGGADADTLYGDEGDDLIYGEAGDDTLYGGAGINRLYGGEGKDALYSLPGEQNALYGGNGDDKYHVYLGSDFTITEGVSEGKYDWLYLYGTATSNVTLVMPDNVEYANTMSLRTVGDARVTLIGNDLDNSLSGRIYAPDILSGGKGNDMLQGYSGGDTYLFGRGDGQDTILEYDNNGMGKADIDRLLFSDDINLDQLWFSRQTDNYNDSLVITLLGTSDKVTVRDWFDGGKYNKNAKLEEIVTKDGAMLTSAQVEDLVGIMSTKAMPKAGYSTLIDDYLLSHGTMV